jgi:hypothetical protein
MKHLLAAAGFLALVGCATELLPGADRVRIVTADQKGTCSSLGIISTEQRTGPNKAGNAMNKALNETYRRGGNGLYIVSSNLDWAEGASVVGESLRCPA